MNNSYSQNGQSPRYMEIDPNGQVLHQSPVVPPEVLTNLSASNGSMAYNSTNVNAHWSNNPYQTSYNKSNC